LDGVYNSYPNPDLITAKEIGDVARKVGLLMEEVLLWFGDEKLRRAELLANCQRQAQKSVYQFPSSTGNARAASKISSTSSAYNTTFPRTPSQSLDIFLPSVASVEQKILAPPTSKRGRPAKTHVTTEPDLSSPEAKRKKISVKYPCPDCGKFVAVECWAEHIDRKHFPENVWECPKTNPRTGIPCSSTPHYRPSYRHDNFATHLKGEHGCLDSEVVELKKTCKFEVTDFFHKVCGFCEKSLGTRDESLEHVKEHLREFSQQPNPPADLGVSLWKEKCGSEHKLQLGVHYRRSQASNPDPMDKSHDHGHDEDENGESGDGNSDNPGHDSSDVQPNNHRRGLQTWDSYQTVPNLYHRHTLPGYPPAPPQLRKNEREVDFNSQDNFSSEEYKEKSCYSCPECGNVFKDLKSHQLTHQNERPQKCPIQTCDYHIKGFARKYDKDRHTLTHYKATMVCGFCPGIGSIAEKSFNRTDLFKRHLTSIHAVKQTAPGNSRKPSIGRNTNSNKVLSGYAPDATGKCSTCTMTFSNAQDFYEHFDDCVLQMMHQQEPSEAINSMSLAETEQDQAVHETLQNNALPATTTNVYSANEDEDEEDFDDESGDDFTLCSKSSPKVRATATQKTGSKNPGDLPTQKEW
jgi:predicted RNA-binding Zn-ribbon protein involved in translation (DUF1610 family)